MRFEEPSIQFINLNEVDIIRTSTTGGETSCVGPTGYQNNCSYYNIDDGWFGHSGSYDGGCDKYDDENDT